MRYGYWTTLALGLLVGGAGAHPGAIPRDTPAREIQPETDRPVFRMGVLLEHAPLGLVSDVTPGKPGQLWVAGQKAIATIEGSTIVSSTSLQEKSFRLKVVDHGGKEPPRFLDRGFGWHGGRLFDENGRVLWTLSGEVGINDVAPADLDGDGTIEFAVGWNGDGGVELCDSTGKRVWRVEEGNVWTVEVLDIEGDGSPEIVHSSASGEITIRDASGKVLRQVSFPFYVSQFTSVPWPWARGAPRLLSYRDGRISALDLKGKVVMTIVTPGLASNLEMNAVPFQPRTGGETFLIVSLTDIETDRSTLLVIDGAGGIVHRRLIPDWCGTLRVVSLAGRKHPTLLIGGTGIIRTLELEP